MKAFTALLGLVFAGAAFAAPTIIETNETDCYDCDKEVAQVCIASPDLATTVGVKTSWNVGDKAHKILFGYQGQMLYRLVSYDKKYLPKFSAMIFLKDGSTFEPQILEHAVTDGSLRDCAKLPTYELKVVSYEGKSLLRLVKKEVKP